MTASMLLPKHLMRRPGEKGGVHAAGVGDQGSSQGAEMLVQQGALGGEIGASCTGAILRRF